MRETTAAWRRRLARLQSLCGPAELVGIDRSSVAPLIAVTCSRLGRDSRLHYLVCQFLRGTFAACDRLGAELLIGSGTAIAPWAERGAELFGVPHHTLVLGSTATGAQLAVRPADAPHLTVDAAVIALADRVEAAYVRRNGRIARCLTDRLQQQRDGSVRVAITGQQQCGGLELVRTGAVGWLAQTRDQPRSNSAGRTRRGLELNWREQPPDCWGRVPGAWLIHCTRARVGPWPEETERQYRDAMLLGLADSADRGPLAALARILRSGLLLASAVASDHRYPVVCFSSRSLADLLSRRCYRPHLGRWDYEPFGIAIRRSAARRLGIQPVIYGRPGDLEGLPDSDRYRFHPHGKTFDWSQEQEWRSPKTINLQEIPPPDVRVFALDSPRARSALADCKWPVLFLRTTASDTHKDYQNEENGYNSV